MTKEFDSTVMQKSKFRNKFLKDKIKQTRKVIELNAISVKKEENEKIYFSSLDTNKITENRTFWRTVVPFSSKNLSKSEKKLLIKLKKILLMINFIKHLTTSFQKLFPI